MSPQIKTIDRPEIAAHLDIAALIAPTVAAFKALSAGKSRSHIDVLHPTNHSDMHVKSAVLDGANIYTVKLAGWAAHNEAAGLPASSGMILVFSAETCRPVAILQDDHLISDLRTAAAGAVAARELSNKDARKVGILGAGEQAFRQIEALRLVRDVREITIWNRSRGKAEKLAGRLKLMDASLAVDVQETPQTVVEAADILVTATASREPLVKAEWLRPGMHITSVGADDATKCELEPACLQRADLVVVDSVQAAAQYGNIRQALEFKAHNVGQLVEIGKILADEAAGRHSRNSITISSFVGLGVQDLAAVMLLRERLAF